MQNLIFQKIQSAVESAQRILLIGHRQPDADALGSLYVMWEWLASLEKDIRCFAPARTDVPSLFFILDPLPFASTEDELITFQPDLVIVMDSGDLKYAGVDQLVPRFAPSPILINIDHHATNQNFGAINWVDASAASTTEMLTAFFQDQRIEITPAMANALLAGIINDTYNFTNSNTTAATFAATGQLVRAGGNLTQVSTAVLQNKPLPAMKVWGGVLSRMVKNEKYGVATALITHSDLDPLRDPNDPTELPSIEVVEGIANFLNNLGGVRMAMVLREQPDGTIKGSLRTNDELLDVSKLAKLLGGGGHKKAAGFTIPGRLVELGEGKWKIV